MVSIYNKEPFQSYWLICRKCPLLNETLPFNKSDIMSSEKLKFRGTEYDPLCTLKDIESLIQLVEA